MRSEISLVACLAAGSLCIAPLFAERGNPRTMIVTSSARGSYIGLGVAEIDSERAKALKLPEERGVEVKNVAEEGPAEKAGLKVGDVVLEFNGQRIEGNEQFARLVRETPVGRQAKLTVWRGGNTQTMTVTIGSRRASNALIGDREFEFAMPGMPGMPPMPPMPEMPRMTTTWNQPILGVETEPLSSQLAEYFGVKDGALVRSVTKDSAAEKAGIKAGDVIVKVDGASVTSAREITSVLRGLRGSKRTFPVTVVRNHKEMTLNVTLPEEATPARRVRAALEQAEV